MIEKIRYFVICLALFFSPVMIPVNANAIDSPGSNIAPLDAQSFIVSKEFAGEIKLYLCSIHNGRIIINDATSIPYMTIEHRNLDNTTIRENPESREKTPIIKTVP